MTTPTYFMIVPKAQIVSYRSFVDGSNLLITDITFGCDGTYITFELPKFHSVVRNLKKGNGILIP
jgi:uncharacterized membrane protein (UPF0182 family)